MKSIDKCPCISDICGLAHSCPINDEQNECQYLEDWVTSSTYHKFYFQDKKEVG